MSDSFSDPKLIISILGIINTTVLTLVFQWRRNRKSLSYEIVSDIPWFSVQQEIQHRVQVLLDGKPVSDAYLVRMRFMNTGRLPIDDKDFVIPLSVSFGESSEILTADITKTSPPDLPAKIVSEKQRVTIEPLVLNWGDTITIQTLVSAFSDPIVTGRVKGIPRIKKLWASSVRSYLGGFFLFGIIISWVLAAVPVQIIINKLISVEQLGVLRYILSLTLAFLLILAPPHVLRRAAQKDMEKQLKKVRA
jgi:hypothetical protein